MVLHRQPIERARPPLDSGHDRVPEDRIGVHWKSGDVVETTPGTFEVQEE